MKDFKHDDMLFFNNKQIEILQLFPNFNLANVKYINSSEEFSIDINFITKQILTEHYLTIKI
ncbi:hypothetical protein J2B92_12435 [Lysinibacillus sphaericus]|uniref:hypothetical protein n=1 Tax=Lysinibacillus sphaericus TaxID=1421 RepID=UPI0018CD77A0|nr:hypothetical protein [Lysinibacillus sphaericus]MBG9756083.1 hypothetical protein [Lysinibacillus sphaericus]QTB11752.1 hypothetical protein J2B92_12435 [Lysinibacillus sphaericus]